MKKIKASNGSLRFQAAENLAGDNILWVDLYGNSYHGYTPKQAKKLVEFLQKKAIPTLKKFVKEHK